MKLFLDDERPCPAGWTLADSVEVLIHYCSEHKPGVPLYYVTDISLDHDLGEGKKTGYDFCRWLEQEVYTNSKFRVPNITIHSANPVGRSNMMRCLESIRRIQESRGQ